MKSRVKNIYRHLEKDVDVIVLANSTDPHLDKSFFYATGITGGLFEGCAAFLHPDGGIDLLSSQLEEETARKSDVPYQTFMTRRQLNRKLNTDFCIVWPGIDGYENPFGMDMMAARDRFAC